MSQQQPRRPQETQRRRQEPIKYGDVFQVSGDLAGQPITPQDAAMMQTAEASVFGQVPSGGPAAAMQAAAAMNERAGVVGRDDATDVARDRGVAVSATEYPGTWVVPESIGGQVLGQVHQYTEVQATTAGAAVVQAQITIGEALEAAIATAGNKPVDQSDAATIQAAEVRATGSNVIAPGGVGAAAQSAAAFNAGLDRDEEKIKLADVLTATTAGAAVVQAQITIGEALEAAIATAGNKPVDQSDAAAIQAAEVRATGSNIIAPSGVGAVAQSAAAFNAGLDRDEEKIKLADVLTYFIFSTADGVTQGATARLPADKVATWDDAERVVTAELSNYPNLTTNPGGVAASVTAAARLNEGATTT